MYLAFFVLIGFIPSLHAEASPTYCWYCGPADNQEQCDKEIKYRKCLPGDKCITIQGTSQQYYIRTCDNDVDYEKYKCEHGFVHRLFCEVASCSSNCIANIGNEGGPFKCPACVGSSEEDCNSRVNIVECRDGRDRCIKKKRNTGVVARGCASEAEFQEEKDSCSDGSCEVSMCSVSHCAA